MRRERVAYLAYLKVLLITFVCAAAGLSCGSSGSESGALPGVAAAARELARAGATSAIVIISDRGQSSVATAGQLHPSANQRFRIGSVTKTFTAALVMQLVDQNRLQLGDSLARYLPGVVPEGTKVTHPGSAPA